LLLAAVGLLWGAGRMHEPLRALRSEYHLNPSDPMNDAPPLMAFTTVALGGFRGILADLLWIRAAALQEKGQYFELVQLSTWITRLEPRFTEAWAYHAWNLAYNISVLFSEPEDRWRWVRSGISLLRDEGLRYNPGQAHLYRELGWLFQHKIGAAMDQAQMYYKQAWAREMMALFDGPAPDYTNMPPESRRRLLEEYRLDPDLMRQVDERYGPLDWRLPQAHALYWAWCGRRYATGFEALACDRMIYQSLGDAFRQGRLTLDKDEEIFLPSPNLDLLPRMLQTLENSMAAHPEEAEIRDAHRLALETAVLMLYTFHRNEDAARLFDELKTRYPSEETAAGFEPFIFHAFTAELEEPSEPRLRELIESAVYKGLFWRALGDDARAAGYDQLAALCWQRTMKQREEDPEWRGRAGLPPLEKIRRQAKERLMQELKSERAKARLIDNIPR
ncbi:MAG: hypothetical protein KKC51_11005, partial [Verrucomicrobia bacterium]|nr:hypothetical protein [Verrucomicrobiota bacterium]